jgi:hypothetical protein
MPYAIMRFAKRKRGSINSMEAHNERRKEQYKSNPDIDTAKSADNYHLIQPQHRYFAEIMSRVEAAKCRVRKDSVLMIEALITASPEFMSVRPVAEQREYLSRRWCSYGARWVRETYLRLPSTWMREIRTCTSVWFQ